MKEKLDRKTVYLPQKLAGFLQKLADSERRSLSSLIANLLEKFMEDRNNVQKTKR